MARFQWRGLRSSMLSRQGKVVPSSICFTGRASENSHFVDYQTRSEHLLDWRYSPYERRGSNSWHVWQLYNHVSSASCRKRRCISFWQPRADQCFPHIPDFMKSYFPSTKSDDHQALNSCDWMSPRFDTRGLRGWVLLSSLLFHDSHFKRFA